MNVSALSLRDLEYVVAVAELGHFGRAARACHVSQPALSSQIRKVEEVLGVPVFERTQRRVAVTATGESVIQQARIVLDEAKKLYELASQPRELLTGRLRLGAIATLGPYFIPHFLGPLRRKHPRLELIFREGLTDGLIGELRSGALDAVLASPTFDTEGLREIPLFVEPFLLAVPVAHPLASRKPLRPADLKVEEMILLEDGHCLRDQTIELCSARRRGGPRQFHATSIETLRHLVGSGLGYTILPWLAADDDRRMKSVLAYRRFDGRQLGRTISIYCRNRFPRAADIEALAGFIRAHLPAGLEKL